MTNPDEARERAIDLHYRLMCSATTRKERHRHCRDMTRLILQRSAARVAEMERDRGLR